MKWKTLGTLGILAFMAALATISHGARAATCDVSISNISPIPNVVYDPFEGVARSVNYNVTFSNTGPDTCSVGLAISSPPAGALRNFKNGTTELRYVLEWPGGAVFANSITSPIGTVAVSGGGGTKSVTLRVKVVAGLIAPAATYSDVLTFRAYRTGSGPLVQVGTDRTATAGAVVEARAQVNIAGTSGTFGSPFALDRIDFGTLASGTSRNAIVQVRATSPVSISVASLNRGRLKHKVLTTDAGVPYAMQLDGASVDLSGTSSTLSRNPPITLDGINYPMNLQIGAVTGRPAGEYQDTLTINVSPF
ncbi:MAG: hypothetical protein ABL996_07680 [Micropepsaceae bacterium]